MNGDNIAPDALEGAAGKVVPLVVYEGSHKRVIGEAFVTEDLSVECHVTQEIDLPGALKAGLVIGAALGFAPTAHVVITEEVKNESSNHLDYSGYVPE